MKKTQIQFEMKGLKYLSRDERNMLKDWIYKILKMEKEEALQGIIVHDYARKEKAIKNIFFHSGYDFKSYNWCGSQLIISGIEPPKNGANDVTIYFVMHSHFDVSMLLLSLTFINFYDSMELEIEEDKKIFDNICGNVSECLR